MTDLMLHLLDVAMNSYSAGARTIKVSITEDSSAGTLRLLVADDGPGMSAEQVDRVLTELATSKAKQSRWVGFGLALLRTTVDQVEGEFRLLSRPGVGTLVEAVMPRDHIDLPPLGDVAGSLQAFLAGCGAVDLVFTRRRDRRGYRLDTRPVRRALGEAYATRAVLRALVAQVSEGERSLAAGEGCHELG